MSTEVYATLKVEGFDHYMVSNLGNVKSLVNPNKPRILKPQSSTNGYLQLNLFSRTGEHRKFLVHRLIGLTFIPNLQDKPQINHIDGDRTNNRVENLEWVTPKENIQHALDNNLMCTGTCHGNSKLKQEDVNFIRDNKDSYRRVDLAQIFGVSKALITNIINGKIWKYN